MSMTVEAPKEGGGDQSSSKLDWKKQKELEEARKAGTAPPEVDEEGRDINPHIPQYITQVPWYVGINRPTLKHQRPQPEKQKLYSGIDEWYKRGISQKNAASKYRKGACENCGAMTHKKKDCLERPRRVGAKFTGEDIQPDEHTQVELSLDYDGKRDRWAGYDVSRHTKIIEEYAKVDEAKRHLKAKQLEEDLSKGKTDAVKVIGDEEDEEKYADGVDMPGQKFDSKMRTTVRNLRIREDTAKYLYNLDLNSAYYDPKTRSMREDPLKEHEKGKMINYGGDNWVRSTGDVRNMAQTQLFAWEAYERGADVHLQADPTKLELLHKEYKVKKESYKKDTKQGILEKYGGEEHLNVPSKELLLAQTEEYVEYSRTGKVVKGQEKAVAKSKYEEDVYINNHSAVWGSFWEDFHWGYSCCHSFIKTSYCTGEAGKVAKKQTDGSHLLATNRAKTEADANDGKSLLELHRARLIEEKKAVPEKESSSLEDDKDKLNLALEAEERRLKYVEDSLKLDERKRSYNSLSTNVKMPTEEEMEAYKIKRQRPEDPMSYFGRN